MYANEWKKNAFGVMDKIEATQMQNIKEVATLMADCIQSGHMVHTFGCGHANLPIEEMYPVSAASWASTRSANFP